MSQEKEKIIQSIDVAEALPQFYLPFSAYVLQTRAIPDSRDGLKSGARFILYAQYLDKLTYNNKMKKASKTVSAAMNFSVHGDASIYGNAIRLSQNFALRYPVIETQGNNGSTVANDDYSQSRYVEMRGNEIAHEMTSLLSKDTIESWRWNYSQEVKYPSVLATKFPFSLVNGNTGIGVGCSSSVPQFNLIDVCNKLIVLLNNEDATFEELYCPIDFATGAIIINEEEVKQSLKTGHGKAAVIRAKIEFNEDERELIVTELPYQTFSSNIVSQLQASIDEGKIIGIESAFDGTDKYGPKIFIKLTKTAKPEDVIRQLYKETSLQSYYSINMVLLDNGTTPKLFSWKEMMSAYLCHLKSILKKSYEYDLAQIKSRIHILEGYLKALESIDRVIEIIKKSENSSDAIKQLISQFDFSQTQAKAILELKLNRLVNMEYIKIKDELSEQEKKALYFEDLINNEVSFRKSVENEIIRIRDKYGDKRRTTNMNLRSVENKGKDEEEKEEYIEEKSIAIYFTNYGNIHVNESSSLIAQHKGGKGIKLKLKPQEYIVNSLTDTNKGTALFFSNLGKFYSFNLENIKIGITNVNDIFKLATNEYIVSIAIISKSQQYKYVVFVTKDGMIKKTLLSEYETKRTNGLVALKLKENDEIVNVLFINDESIGILSNESNFLLIDSKEINAIGRGTSGVKGIKLDDDARVVDARPLSSNRKYILTISKKGIGKISPIEEYPLCSRYIKGSIAQKLQESDEMASFEFLENLNSEVIITTGSNIATINVAEIPCQSRPTIGVQIVKTNEGNEVNNLIIR